MQPMIAVRSLHIPTQNEPFLALYVNVPGAHFHAIVDDHAKMRALEVELEAALEVTRQALTELPIPVDSTEIDEDATDPEVFHIDEEAS